MTDHWSAASARIREIEGRIAALSGGAPGMPPAGLQPAARVGDRRKTFPLALAEAQGSVRLEPLPREAPVASDRIEALIGKYASENGLAPSLLRAVIEQESGGNPRAVSRAGARGLMQLMPATAEAYGVTDAFDPDQNIAAGARHLAGLLREFTGDLPRALAAYNAGTMAVHRAGGIPAYAETRNYVRSILARLGHGPS